MNLSQHFLNLDSLVELSNKLNSSRNLEFILNTILLSLMGKLGFFRGGSFICHKGKIIQEIVVKGSLDRSVVNFFAQDICRYGEIDKKVQVIFSENFLHIILPFTNEDFVLLILESRFKKSDFTTEENHYLQLVSNMAANALEIASHYQNLYRTNIELQKRNQLLSTLFEINKDFSFYFNKEQIISQLRYRILGQLLVNKFAVFYKENDTIVELLNTLNFVPQINVLSSLFQFGCLTFIDDSPVTIPEVLKEFLTQNQIQIISPMKFQNITRGVLLLGKKYTNQQYTEEDLNFIEAIGNTVILSIENFRLLQEEIKKKNIEKELQLALEIQQNLLPKELPKSENFDLWGISIPAKIVGGDYFDFIQTNHNKLYLAIADVSGKGIPASLLMANVQSTLRILTKMNLSLFDIINHINSIVYKNTTSEKFITFFLGELNIQTLEFKYINAGHNPPVLFRKETGEYIYLTKGGLFLGFLDSPVDYEIGCINLMKNDLLLLYTDGVIECENQNQVEFGIKKLEEFIGLNHFKISKDLCNLLLEEVIDYCGTNEFKDDFSLVVLKIK